MLPTRRPLVIVMPYLERDGIHFYYEISGEGRALVFCHGLTGNLENAKELLGDFAGFRLIFWDSRGHGKTQPAGPAQSFNFDTFARDLAAILDHLGIGRAVVGGISMGAAVSTRFAVLCPERVRALVLVRPAWLTDGPPEGLKFHPMVSDLLGRYGAEHGREVFERSPEYQKLLHRSPMDAAALAGQFAEAFAVERRARLDGIPRDAPIRDWSEVNGVVMPSLVIGNEPDFIHPLAYAVEWAKRLPNGRLVQVPPKAIDFESHALAVRSNLREFLSGVLR